MATRVNLYLERSELNEKGFIDVHERLPLLQNIPLSSTPLCHVWSNGLVPILTGLDRL